MMLCQTGSVLSTLWYERPLMPEDSRLHSPEDSRQGSARGSLQDSLQESPPDSPQDSTRDNHLGLHLIRLRLLLL